MAKAKYGNIIVDMRGSINGNTYSKNAYGAFVRTKTTPVNPQSAAQQDVRSDFQVVSQGWRSLTASQRTAWNEAAPVWTRTNVFGDSVPLDGFNLYMKLNLNLKAIGGTAITTPPAIDTVTGVLAGTLTADNSSNSLSLAFAVSPAAATVTHLVYATPAMSPGKTFVGSRYRLIGTIAPSATTPATISAAYNTKFGAIGAVGLKIAVKIVPILTLTGQPGTSSETSTLIVA